MFEIRRGRAGNHLSGEAERGRRRRSHCQNLRRIQRGRRSEKGQRQFERKVSPRINVLFFCYLTTYIIGDVVIKLLQDGVIQTQNPYAILIPY